MLPYLIFVISALFFSWVFDRQPGYSRPKLVVYGALCLYLICLSGFSYGLGADKWAYLTYFEGYNDNLDRIFDDIVHELKHMGFMPLWTLLNLVVKSTTNSFYVLQFIESTIVCVSVCAVARRHTQYGFFFLLIFFVSETYFQFNTEVMREGFSIALGLWAIEAYMHDRKWVFYLLVLLAFLFHFSAVVLLAFPLSGVLLSRGDSEEEGANASSLGIKEPGRLWYLLVLVSAFVGWVLGEVVLIRLVDLTLSGNAFATKLATYTAVRTTFFGFARSFLWYLALPLAAMYFTRKLDVSAQERAFRLRMLAFFAFLGILACTIPGMVRFMNYVQIFVLLIYTELCMHLTELKLHFLPRLAVVLLACVFNIWYDLTYWPKNDFYLYEFFYPYTSILDEDSEPYYRKEAHTEATDYSFYDTME